MKTILHIRTRPEDDALAREVIREQEKDPDLEITVADLSQDEPDYRKLLEQVFAADSVQVWC